MLRTCLGAKGLQGEDVDVVRTWGERTIIPFGHLLDFGDLGATLARLLPIPFLQAVFEDDRVRPALRVSRLREGSVYGHNPLSDLPLEALLAWLSVDPTGRAPLVASCLSPFRADQDGGHDLTAQALAVLDATPEPRPVVVAYAGAIVPMSWSGTRSDIIASRAKALGRLLEHEDPVIREAVPPMLAGIEDLARRERERERERQEDEDRDRTFE